MTLSVMVYVEGQSDVKGMEALLRPLLDQKAEQGVKINFYEAPPGDKKASLMTKTPANAVKILKNNPYAHVVIMPDLYPLKKALPHETAQQLKAVIRDQFTQALKREGLADDQRFHERFAVFCFKYDLEALVLSALQPLALRLGVKAIQPTWRLPVEDQNNDTPPKKVVEALFKKHHTHYRETVDAVGIMGGVSDYRTIAQACPQEFAPFVMYLEGLSAG